MNPIKLAATALAASILSLAATGCSATTAARSTIAQPAVAFGASPSDLAGGCAMEGTPRVVATHVMPKGGVSAVESDGRVWLRFGTTHDERAVLALDPRSLDVLDADAPAESARTAAPVQVQLGAHRKMVAWTEGTVETGLSVKVATVDDEGVTSPPADLGFEGSAIGRPAMASTPEGQGVVAFIESSGVGFHLVVTRVTCPASR